MKCCEKCFSDHLLQDAVRENKETGDCDYCDAKGIAVVEASKLYDIFSGLISLYEPVEYGMHFHKEFGPDAIDIGDWLPNCIEEDGWGVFNEDALSPEKQCELLDDIRHGNECYDYKCPPHVKR